MSSTSANGDPNKKQNKTWSTDDAVNMALHYVLSHLDTAGNYARILFVDFSSAFNTIRPPTLAHQLDLMKVPASTCRWITDFLTNRPQRVKLGKNTSETRFISTGSPQGCVLSPHIFVLQTNLCISLYPSVKLGRLHPSGPHQGRGQDPLQEGD